MPRIWSIRRSMSIALLVLPLMAAQCATTTQISSQIARSIHQSNCETAKFYWYKPTREEYSTWDQTHKNWHKTRLDAYRREQCPEILGER